MDLGLKGKVALVAGASQGLGYAVALGLAREGAHVAIASRDTKRINTAADSIRKETNGSVMPSTVDVTRAEEISNWVDEVVNKHGTVHIAITNTAGPPSLPFMETNDEKWEKALNLTLLSAVRLSQAVIPAMQKQNWGRIIHLTSLSVKNPIPNMVFSNSIRSAVVAMGKTQSDELASYGILVNSVLQGWTNTERVGELLAARAQRLNISKEEAYTLRQNAIPLKRMAEPHEIADPVIFLASERASFITGTTLTVDGGETRFPF